MNYLWIGSKGHGPAVTTLPLNKTSGNYNNLSFRRFEYSPTDSSSISNNNIYGICQDKAGNIWVGTYGNGLNLVKDPYGNGTKFVRINQQNSNISSNLVRHLLVDSSGNLWVATTFGLNLLNKGDIETGNFRFKVFLRSISVKTALFIMMSYTCLKIQGGSFGSELSEVGRICLKKLKDQKLHLNILARI